MRTEYTDMSWPGWETVRLIGRGSFGAVYEIQRDVLGDIEKAALKVISIPQNASDIDEMHSNGYDEESIVNTFRHYLKSIVAEYSMMRKLSDCPNIVTCDDVRYIQHDDGIGWDIYIKMELLTPLLKSLQHPISEETVVKLAKDICAALIACKKYNIVHRDIKPQNIFLAPSGIFKLGDFGIAKTVEKTMGGTKIGTYNYMAPEVYNNQPYGSAADIYSLGLVLYWMLNERRMPFLPLPPAKMSSSQDTQARMRRLSGEQIPEPKNGSKQLKKIVMKACTYNVADRYASASDMLKDLNQIEQAQTGSIGTVNVIPIEGKSPDNGAEHEYDTIDVVRREDPYGTVISDPGDKTTDLGIVGNKTDEDTVSTGTQTLKGDDENPAGSHTSDPSLSPRPIKRYVFLGVGLVALAVLIFILWPRHTHVWEAATCYLPKTCSECKETEGSELGHQLIAATCEKPEYCARCNKEFGKALDHAWQQATLTTPETCSLCLASKGNSIEEQILLDAQALAECGLYRQAIHSLDNAWNTYGKQSFFDRAADYRMKFGMHANSVLAAGKFNSILLNPAGNPKIVGDNEFKELQANDWSNMLAVSLGDRHVLGLAKNGTILAAGSNDLGQCNVYGWQNAIAISAGDTHSVALLENGRVVATGFQYPGECDTDALMSKAGNNRIVAISAGHNHTLALLDNGRVVGTGYEGDHFSHSVSGWSNMALIVTGTRFSAGLRTDGTVVVTEASWDVSGWNDIIALAAGDFFLLGLRSDGSVVSVGGGEKIGITKWRNICYDVSKWENIAYIAAGHDHAVAIDYDGKVYNAGSNEENQHFEDGTNIYN